MDNTTHYRVACFRCGVAELSKEEYNRQMDKEYALWQCPICKETAQWAGVFEDCYDPRCEGEIQIDGDQLCSKCHRYGEELFYEFDDSYPGCGVEGSG